MQLFTFVGQKRPGRFAMATGGRRARDPSATELKHVIGSRKKLSDTELPTFLAVLRHGLYLKDLKYTEEMAHKTILSVQGHRQRTDSVYSRAVAKGQHCTVGISALLASQN